MTTTTGTRTGASMAIAAILSVQLGLAVAVGLFDRIGPQGAAWLRLAWAGVLIITLCVLLLNILARVIFAKQKHG